MQLLLVLLEMLLQMLQVRRYVIVVYVAKVLVK